MRTVQHEDMGALYSAELSRRHMGELRVVMSQLCAEMSAALQLQAVAQNPSTPVDVMCCWPNIPHSMACQCREQDGSLHRQLYATGTLPTSQKHIYYCHTEHDSAARAQEGVMTAYRCLCCATAQQLFMCTVNTELAGTP